jgi:hypothetical protein
MVSVFPASPPRRVRVPQGSPASVRFDSDQRLARLGLLLYLLPTIFFIRTDLLLLARGFDHVDLRFGVRAFALVGLIFMVAAVGRARERRQLDSILIVAAWTIAALMLLMNSLRPEGSALPMRSPIMALLVMYGTLHLRPRHLIVPAVVFSLGLVVLRLTRLTSTADGDVAGDVVVLAVVNAIGIALTVRRRDREAVEDAAWTALRTTRDAAEQALRELKTLRGIIPICSHCRQVRTEAGAWQQLERYVRAHTEAEFSHGICPDCLAQHYSELRLG